MASQTQSDPATVDYVLTTFPPEMEALRQLIQDLHQFNQSHPQRLPVDFEVLRVTHFWMQRVLRRAEAGELDVPAIFVLSSCLATTMPAFRKDNAAVLAHLGKLSADDLNSLSAGAEYSGCDWFQAEAWRARL